MMTQKEMEREHKELTKLIIDIDTVLMRLEDTLHGDDGDTITSLRAKIDTVIWDYAKEDER